jgi:predicted RNA binding protein YcfA (HicA-like mRNA interferase family)
MRAREIEGCWSQLTTEAGWQLLRVEGSHHQLGKDGLRTSVPMHGTKDLKPGTLAAIQRQTGVKLK